MKGTTFILAITAVLFSFTLSSCGGSSGAGAVGPSEGDDVEAGAGVAPPSDPVSEQAAKFCEHSIEKAKLQPPDALDRKQIAACLTAVGPKLQQACSKGIAREVLLKIIIDKSGAVFGAFPIGDAADSPEATCVAETVKTVAFPQFKGSAQQVISKYPFALKP